MSTRDGCIPTWMLEGGGRERPTGVTGQTPSMFLPCFILVRRLRCCDNYQACQWGVSCMRPGSPVRRPSSNQLQIVDDRHHHGSVCACHQGRLLHQVRDWLCAWLSADPNASCCSVTHPSSRLRSPRPACRVSPITDTDCSDPLSEANNYATVEVSDLDGAVWGGAGHS